MKSSSPAFSILFVCVLLFSLVELSLSLNDFEVFRLVAYENESQTYGSKINAFTLQGSHFAGDLLRKLALIHFAEINQETLATLLGKKAAGILIILPNQFNAEKESAAWAIIEENLVHRVSQYPVFFIWENEQILDFYRQTASSNSKSDSSLLNFVLNGPEPRLIKPLQLEDFIGVLDQNAPLNKLTATSNPVIAVISSYDSYSFVPEAKLGLTQSTSGAIVLLNVARTLSDFFEHSSSAGYNVLFYLSGGKQGGYEGFHTWLTKAESSKVVSKVEFAILLDDLHSAKDLTLTVHNVDETSTERINNFAKKFKNSVEIHKVKATIDDSNRVLFNKKFPVIKVSNSNSNKNWINGRTFDKEALKTNILAVSEFLVRSLYNITTDYQIVDSSIINERYLSGLVNLFESKSTFPLHITKDSPVTQEVYRAFNDVTKHTGRQAYTYANLQLYTTEAGGLKMIKMASAFFDLYVLIANFAWLSAIYYLLSNSSGSDRSKKD